MRAKTNVLTVLGVAALVLAAGAAQAWAFVDSFFDVFTELSVDVGQPINVGVFNGPDSASAMHLEDIQFGIKSVTPVGSVVPPDVRITMKGGDGGGAGGGSVESFFDVFTELSVDGGSQFMVESFFDVFTELSTGSPGRVRSFHVEEFPAESFFDVFVEVDIPGLFGYQGHHLHFAPAPGQPVALDLPSGDFAVDSFFDAGAVGCRRRRPAGSPPQGARRGLKAALETLRPELGAGCDENKSSARRAGLSRWIQTVRLHGIRTDAGFPARGGRDDESGNDYGSDECSSDVGDGRAGGLERRGRSQDALPATAGPERVGRASELLRPARRRRRRIREDSGR
ncbi:MAG: hypothetical protein AMS14_11460 [Planctomycetes bacterium DG_20]|nr:MAG: hypothetical protein AMS14_11460 [Planctomycetes bacterium DG_20]